MAFNYLYTTIFGVVFATIAIAYIYLRTTYSREVINKEKLLEYKYRQYKYVIFALVIFLILTYAVYKIEDSNKENRDKVCKLQRLINILKKINNFKQKNKLQGLTYQGLLYNIQNKENTLSDEEKITKDDLLLLNQFYYIHSNEYKPLKALLDDSQIDILLTNLEDHIKMYDSALYKDIIKSAGSCALNISRGPISGLTGFISDIYRKEKKYIL
jgi:hypothetical protein